MKGKAEMVEIAVETFWDVFGQKERLTHQLAKLTHKGKSPRGFSFMGWHSPQRLRARHAAKKLESIDLHFARLQSDYVAKMRQNASELVLQTISAVRLEENVQPRPRLNGGEFTKARVEIRGSIRFDLELEKKESLMLERLERERP